MPISIAPPPYYGTLFFTDRDGNDGWSESHWIKSRDAMTYEEAMEDLLTVAERRRTLMTFDNVIAAARISATNVKRDTIVETDDSRLGVGLNKGGHSNLISAPDFVALQLRMQTALVTIPGDPPVVIPPRFVTKFLHGLPADFVGTRFENAGQRVFAPSPEWIAAWKRYVSIVIDRTRLVIRVAGSPRVLMIRDMFYKQEVRNKKVGRPFDLLRGRSAIR